jgi:hypothetical protein
MRRFQLIYVDADCREVTKVFDTFVQAEDWAKEHCHGWWTIANYYGE